MKIYIILIVLIDILVMIGMTVHGAHKGFAKLLSGAISLILAIFVVIQISGIINNYKEGNGSNVLIGILMLIILGILYKIIHVILSSIRFLSKLPVLSGADKIFGTVLGFCEGFAILYIGEYILRVYLLQ